MAAAKTDRVKTGVRELLRDCRGAVAVEFALVTPILLLILLHVVDLGMAFHEKMETEVAARAGFQYALFDKDDATGIRNAVTSATDLPPEELTVNVTSFCQCADGSAATCGDVCTAGDFPGTYVQVSVTKDFSAVLSLYGLPSEFEIDGTAVGRVQ
jgi:Flp pilus assembly protein TadG